MLTKTAKVVLLPLADAVSALIIVISDSQISSSPVPNLSPLASAVDGQISNLVRVAVRITQQASADQNLQACMPPACKQVTDASALLVSSTSELLLNAHSLPAKQSLLEAVKGILQGTTLILSVFDESECVKILNATLKVRDLLGAVDAFDDPDKTLYLNRIKQFSQKLVVCLQLCSKRVKDILLDRLATDLQDAIDCMVKESSFYMSAAKMVLSHPKSPEALAVQKASKVRLEKESLRIDAIVSCKDGELFYATDYSATKKDKYTVLRNEILAEPLSTQWKASPANTREKMVTYIAEARIKLNSESAIIEHIPDLETKAFPLFVVEKSNGFFNSLNDLLEDATLAFNEKYMDHDSRKLVLAIDTCVSALDASVTKGIVAGLIELSGDLSEITSSNSTIGLLKEFASKGNVKGVSKSTSEFEKKSTKLSALVEHVLKHIPSSNPSNGTITLLHRKMINSIPGISTASKLYQKFPEESNEKHLQSALVGFAEVSSALQKQLVLHEGEFTADELLGGAHAAFHQHAVALSESLAKNDEITATKEMNLTLISANQLIAIIEKEKENNEDPVYRGSLEKELVTIRTAVQFTLLKASEMLNHIGHLSSNDSVDLHKSIEELAKRLASVSNVVRGYKGTLQAPQIPVVTLHISTVAVPVATAPVELVEAAPIVQITASTSVLDETAAALASSVILPVPEVVVASVEIATPAAPIVDIIETEAVAPQTADAFVITAQEQGRLLEEAQSSQDDQLRSLTSAIKELVIVNEQAPKMLSVIEAAADPIKAAGQELRVEASHWSAESNPIVICVTNIGQKFLDLSACHKLLSSFNPKPADKKAFIQTAQDIMSETAQLIKAVEPLIRCCADKRLVLQIQQTTARISTLAQTLKVIAAVKASSPRDSDKAVQLITNGQNLVQSVKAVLRDAISCSIRLKKGTEPDVVHFKKQVYYQKAFK